jgi:hypothetical protein
MVFDTTFSTVFQLYRVGFTFHNTAGGHRGRDRMVVGFTTIYAISAYHH